MTGKEFFKKRPAVTALVFLVVIAAAAFVIPLFSNVSYSGQDPEIRNLAPSLSHLFGTDKFGRDIFIRVCWGVRISLCIGIGSACINTVLGTVLGGMAGYLGGIWDRLITQIMDVIAAIPSLLYVVLIMLAFGSSVHSILLGICVAGWISTARMVRGEVQRLRAMDFCTAAEVSGNGTWRMLFYHLFPNLRGMLVVNLTILIPEAIFTEAFLSFVGIGISAPMASLGTLIQDARSQMFLYPYQLLIPAGVLCILILALHILGHGLEESLEDGRRSGTYEGA